MLRAMQRKFVIPREPLLLLEELQILTGYFYLYIYISMIPMISDE